MAARISARVTAAAVFAVALAACGEAGVLDGLGTRSQDAVLEDLQQTTTTVIVDTEDGTERTAVAAADVDWYNDVIERQFQGEPSLVVNKVWQRREGESRFIQASRLEISQALPDVRFPGLLPEDVGWITSQLVYDVSSATLDRDISAAFGLWAVEPYTVTEGRVAVLRVGQADEDDQLRGFDILADPVDDGLSLSWVTGAYRYELFCRASLVEDLCWQMAETNKRLAAQLRGSSEEEPSEDATEAIAG